MSKSGRSGSVVGWYVLAVFLAGGSAFTAASAETPVWLAAGLGLALAGVAVVTVLRSAPQEGRASSPRAVAAAVGAVAVLAIVRVLDSGLALHLLVTVALGILVGALWRRARLK